MPRNVAIYLVHHHSRNTRARVGGHFEIPYGTVSSVVEQVKARKNRDRTLESSLKSQEENSSKGNGRFDSFSAFF